jgi:Xaa-Pro aminopeptidase
LTLINEKVSQAKKLLAEFDVDCWITFVRETALNSDPVLPFLVPSDLTWHSALIVNRQRPNRAIVGRYDVQTLRDTGVWDEVEGFVEGVSAPLQAYMKQLQPRSIAINYSIASEICDGLSHGMYLTLYRALDEIGMSERLISAEPIISALRERKSASELAQIRAAIRQTQEIFALVRDFIRPGQSEAEVAAFLRAQVAARGLEMAWDAAVCPAVFTGPDTAGAHYPPTDRKIEPGHILNMDFGVRVNGYCADLQRTFYVLREGEAVAPKAVEQGFTTLVQAIEASRQALQPGVAGWQVDQVARAMVTDAGYEEFPHGLGHQVGRSAHDGSTLLGPLWEKYAAKAGRMIEENMVFTLEPRLPVPGHGIATIEEMVLVTANGAEFLSLAQDELWLVPASGGRT